MYKAKHEETRMCFTLVGVICSDPNIQPLLPQVIFLSEKQATWAFMDEIWQHLPPNVYVKRKSSAWTDIEQHKVIIQMIAKILEPYTGTHEVPTQARQKAKTSSLQSHFQYTWHCTNGSTHTMQKHSACKQVCT